MMLNPPRCKNCGAETASIPTFRALDKKMAAEGEP